MMRASPDGTNFTSQIKPCNSELSCGLFVALLGIAQKKHDLDGGRSDPVLSWNNSVSDVSRPLAPFTKPLSLSLFIPLPIRHQLFRFSGPFLYVAQILGLRTDMIARTYIVLISATALIKFLA